MTPQLSIIISSYNRLPLLRRTLWAIATRGPSVSHEVILVDDGSTDNILDELKKYSSRFLWKFISFDKSKFELYTGLKKFLNNPCVTNNIGFRHSSGRMIVQQGNEVIAWDRVYDQLIVDAPVAETDLYMVMSTTFDIPREAVEQLDAHGAGLDARILKMCEPFPLQSKHYRSDVTNYICLASRQLWLTLQGYDERYYAGISAEDSDFVRRARCLRHFKQVISDGISLHQYHAGKTCYYSPPPSVITKQQWDQGVAINHAVYNDWDHTHHNRQSWDWGTLGVGEIITNG